MKWFIVLLTYIAAFVCWRDDSITAPLDPMVLIRSTKGLLKFTGTDPRQDPIFVQTPDLFDTPMEIIMPPGTYAVTFVPDEGGGREVALGQKIVSPSPALHEILVSISPEKSTTLPLPLILLTSAQEDWQAKGAIGLCGSGPKSPICTANQVCATLQAESTPACYDVCNESTACRTGICTAVIANDHAVNTRTPISDLLHICVRTTM